jgi:tRNA(fMet)-specific endonuclease VapC
VKHLDTSFVVDLLRDAERGRSGPAGALLEQWGDEELRLSAFVLSELLAGASLTRAPDRERLRVRELCAPLAVVYPDERFAPTYARLFVALERTGRRVAAMDLLIATAAVVEQAPLVTANEREFARIGELEVVGYRAKP